MIKTIKELKLLTVNLTDFSNTDLLKIHPSIICNLPQEQKNQWFIQNSISVHNNKYDYSKIVYKNDNTKVTFICPEHGSFFQAPYSHLKGHGCPKCAGNKKKTTEQFIAEAKVIHGDKYNYSKVSYVNTDVKVNIICSRHGDFEQFPYSHLAGHGCPKCSSSKGESQIRSILLSNNIQFIEQYNFNKRKDLKNKSSYMTFDFYLPDYNLCIEYDGGQHFEIMTHGRFKTTIEDLKDTQRRDSIKNQFCLNNNIRLLRVPYWVKVSTNMILQIIEQKSTITSVIK